MTENRITESDRSRRPGTEEVPNQPPLRGDRDLWAEDQLLRSYGVKAGADAGVLSEYGRWLGLTETREAGRQANRQPPELVRFDRGGRRIDRVDFHPAYHAFMARGIAAGYSAIGWRATDAGHVSHAAMVYLTSQVEPGVCCPMTMTYAGVAALRAQDRAPEGWQGKLTAREYDRRPLPLRSKSGATMGMAMTEKQGGSDVRATQTRAEPDGRGYRLYGHKWFCSAPMSDGFLTLAQAPGGLSCFLVPRVLDDGCLNAVHLLRLKDKLGNRSNASAEIEYDGAWALPLGEEGDGVRSILPMVHHTRLDTAMAPAGLMRAALDEAYYWCGRRAAFGRLLIDQPLMRNVLADLVLDWEASVALGFRVARAFGTADPDEAAFARVGVALAKFLSNKRAPGLIYEAMEALGGMGYVEDTPLPLLYREGPLNSIWEGSGNVICLDILRSLEREPRAGAALDQELDAARGADRRYDMALEAHRARWGMAPPEAEARFFAEALAALLSASVLLRTAPGAVADGYCATRLLLTDGTGGRVAGSVGGLDQGALLQRLAH